MSSQGGREIEKFFCSIFGSNENFKICFRDYLTFKRLTLKLVTCMTTNQVVLVLDKIKLLKIKYTLPWYICTVFLPIVSPFNSFCGNYSIYEVKDCQKLYENFPIFHFEKRIVSSTDYGRPERK